MPRGTWGSSRGSLSLFNIMLNLMHSPCTIYALSMHHLCTVYARAMGFYDKDMKKWSMNFGKIGKEGRKRKKWFNRAFFGKIGKMRGFRKRRKQGLGKGCRGGVFLSK